MPEIAYVNGRFGPLSEAVIHVEDRGFQFADGVYEVVVAYGDRVFRLDEHLHRLQSSLDALKLSKSVEGLDFAQVIHEGITRAGFERTMVYLQVTRGVCARVHVPVREMKPTVVATFKPKPALDPEWVMRGARICTMEDIRWARCFIKSVALLPTVLAKMEAIERGFDDAIFLGEKGEVREATAANVFAVRRGELWTPPKSANILQGVTRTYVLECAVRLGIPTREGPFTLREMIEADEVFLSSTTVDILGVTRLNDSELSGGRPGPMTRSLLEEFRRGMLEDVADGELASGVGR